MTEILIGIAVGTAVAIIGQLIAVLFDLAKRRESEKRKSKAIAKMLFQELVTIRLCMNITYYG